jgi:hypothetical protein
VHVDLGTVQSGGRVVTHVAVQVEPQIVGRWTEATAGEAPAAPVVRDEMTPTLFVGRDQQPRRAVVPLRRETERIHNKDGLVLLGSAESVPGLPIEATRRQQVA